MAFNKPLAIPDKTVKLLRTIISIVSPGPASTQNPEDCLDFVSKIRMITGFDIYNIMISVGSDCDIVLTTDSCFVDTKTYTFQFSCGLGFARMKGMSGPQLIYRGESEHFDHPVIILGGAISGGK